MCRPPGDNTPAREAGLLLRDGRVATQHACAGTRLRTQTPMGEAFPSSCGCAMTPTRLPRRLSEASGPALLSQYAGARQKGGASALQTNASAAARRGVTHHRGCAGARPPAVTAVARGERRSRGACAGGFAGARGKFAPSARQPGRRRRRRREAEPGDHPTSSSPESPHVPQPHLTSHPPPIPQPRDGSALQPSRPDQRSPAPALACGPRPRRGLTPPKPGPTVQPAAGPGLRGCSPLTALGEDAAVPGTGGRGVGGIQGEEVGTCVGKRERGRGSGVPPSPVSPLPPGLGGPEQRAPSPGGG